MPPTTLKSLPWRALISSTHPIHIPTHALTHHQAHDSAFWYTPPWGPTHHYKSLLHASTRILSYRTPRHDVTRHHTPRHATARPGAGRLAACCCCCCPACPRVSPVPEIGPQTPQASRLSPSRRSKDLTPSGGPRRGPAPPCHWLRNTETKARHTALRRLVRHDHPHTEQFTIKFQVLHFSINIDFILHQ